MHYLLNTPLVLAAVVAALVSLLGVIVSVWSARLQVKPALRKIEVEIESLKQTELRDILAKRLEAYPKLWFLLQTYVSNWIIDGKPMDKNWATDFLSKLNACHAEFGVLFSQPYTKAFMNSAKH